MRKRRRLEPGTQYDGRRRIRRHDVFWGQRWKWDRWRARGVRGRAYGASGSARLPRQAMPCGGALRTGWELPRISRRLFLHDRSPRNLRRVLFGPRLRVCGTILQHGRISGSGSLQFSQLPSRPCRRVQRFRDPRHRDRGCLRLYYLALPGKTPRRPRALLLPGQLRRVLPRFPTAQG